MTPLTWRRPAAILLALLALAPAAAAATDGRFERTLRAGTPVTLKVSTGSGSIDVKPGPDGEVRVIGTIRGASSWRSGSEEEIARAVKAVEANPPIVQEGSAVRIGAITDEEISRRVSISFEVTVPASTAVTAETGSGAQDIGSVRGPVTASSGSGSVKVGGVDAGVEVRTGSGSVDIQGAKGSVSVSTGSGSVAIGAITGKTEVHTGSGSISIDRVASERVELSSASGRITVTDLQGGLDAHTSSASIHVAGRPTADWQARTSSGSITLDIPDGTPFRLRASTNSGRIHTDHKLSVTTVGQRELIGSVGEGGIQVSAETSSGSIQVGRR